MHRPPTRTEKDRHGEPRDEKDLTHNDHGLQPSKRKAETNAFSASSDSNSHLDANKASPNPVEAKTEIQTTKEAAQPAPSPEHIGAAQGSIENLQCL